MNEKALGVLDATLNVLVLEDEEVSYELVQELLTPVTVYRIQRVATCNEALELIRSGLRFHVVIMDLGITDVQNDEYYLLRTYANQFAFIVFTASTSPSKGAICMQLGARAVFDKKPPFDSRSFVKLVNNQSLINIVNPHYRPDSGDTRALATKILLEKNPSSVTQWAEYLRISDRQLRNLWSSEEFGARYVLFLYQFYSSAFTWFEAIMFGTPLPPDLEDASVFEKMAEYYISHQAQIHSFLS